MHSRLGLLVIRFKAGVERVLLQQLLLDNLQLSRDRLPGAARVRQGVLGSLQLLLGARELRIPLFQLTLGVVQLR